MPQTERNEENCGANRSVLPRVRKWAGHAQISWAIVVVVVVQFDALPVRRPVLALVPTVAAAAHAPRGPHRRLVIRALLVASTVGTLRFRLGYRRRTRTCRGKRCG